MKRGEIWWADLPDPEGSEPGFRRPVVVVQSNPFNDSAIATVLVAVMTSNLQRADAPGNVRVSKSESGLSKPSVINVSQVATIDKWRLSERVKMLPASLMSDVDDGLRLVMGL